jgi:hypothetical protein
MAFEGPNSSPVYLNMTTIRLKWTFVGLWSTDGPNKPVYPTWALWATFMLIVDRFGTNMDRFNASYGPIGLVCWPVRSFLGLRLTL